MKKCSKCGDVKPLDLFPKRKGAADGHRADCKACKRVIDNKWREANRDRMLAKMKEYHVANSDVIKTRAKEWAVANRDRVLAYRREYYQANKDKINIPYDERVKRNPNLVAAQRARGAKYYAGKMNATPPWLTDEHIEKMKKVYEESSRITKETGVQHHVDHIVPLQGENVCGLHVPWNLRVITAQENISKGNRYD